MSKVEDLANEIYKGDTPITRLRRKDYCDGYHQAEKDLKLSWVDMFRIDEITSQVFKDSYTCQMEVIHQEVLKRFEDYRERKEK